jgi:hypothetical protein
MPVDYVTRPTDAEDVTAWQAGQYANEDSQVDITSDRLWAMLKNADEVGELMTASTLPDVDHDSTGLYGAHAYVVVQVRPCLSTHK